MWQNRIEHANQITFKYLLSLGNLAGDVQVKTHTNSLFCFLCLVQFQLDYLYLHLIFPLTMEMTLKMVLDERQWARYTHTHTTAPAVCSVKRATINLQLYFCCPPEMLCIHHQFPANLTCWAIRWYAAIDGCCCHCCGLFSFSQDNSSVLLTQRCTWLRNQVQWKQKKKYAMYIWPLHNSPPIIASFQSNCDKTTAAPSIYKSETNSCCGVCFFFFSSVAANHWLRNSNDLIERSGLVFDCLFSSIRNDWKWFELLNQY